MGEVIALDPIASVFGAQGALARAFPGYAPRDGQVAMARLVTEVLRDGGAMLCDAPCGIGKSVAYLAPAILRAVKRGERVVVATAGIALQEQLIGKDLPTLKAVLAPLLGEKADAWSFAMLKGRSNYLCKSLSDEPEQRAEWESSLSQAELSQLAQVDAWAARTETGDRSELPFVVSENAWRLRSMTTEDCHGKSCDHYKSCFAKLAHERAKAATVIVINFHVLFAHIAVRMETNDIVSILPEFQALVMDEAHDAGDIARDFFKHSLSDGRVKRVVKWARNAAAVAKDAGITLSDADRSELSRVANETEAAGATFFRAIASAIEPLIARKITTLRSDATACAPALAPLSALAQQYDFAHAAAGRFMERVVGSMPSLFASVNDDNEDAMTLRRLHRDAERVRRYCHKASGWMEDAARDKSVAREPGDLDCIHWVNVEESTRRGSTSSRITWESRHVDLSSVLRQEIWDKIPAVVACSATMTTGQGATGWQWIRRQLGAPADARVLSVASPFDFAHQAVLCLPSGTHDPKKDREGFDAFVLDVLAQVTRAAGGRTLGLFTSSRMARAAAEHLRSTVVDPQDSLGFTVLAQGDAPRTQLVSQFKRDETSVLCGTSSLWTGVDVPGRACVCVVVDKLPFAPPGDPVLDALCERAVARAGGREIAGFMEESLPRAVLALRQGVGRLIRSTSDWGCVVICDPRLTTKGYGADILRALAMPTRTRSVAEACAWLARGVAEMTAGDAAMGVAAGGTR